MEGACDLLEPHELRRQQKEDPALKRLHEWLVAGRRPERQEMMVFGPEVKAYYSQWATITLCDGLLYRQWQTPDGKATLLQLLVPRSLQHQVLRLVHGSVGTDHFGVAKTLRRLRIRFYWAGCWLDVQLYVHCCDTCTTKKGPTRRPHAPLQQYLVGAPMEHVGVDILGSFPVSEAGNRYVLIAMDF